MRSPIVVARCARRLPRRRGAGYTVGKVAGITKERRGMVRARVVAVTAAMIGALLCASEPASADSCDTGNYTGAEQVVKTAKPQGYDVTAVYGEGVYHVSRCTAAGDLIEGQTV